MTSKLTSPSSQLSSNLPIATTSNQIPPAPDPTVGVSARELCERVTAARHAISTLLKDTKWPLPVDDAAQNLRHTITELPDLPPDIIPFKNIAEQFLRALEATHISVKNASEKYGKKERGFRDSIKYKIASLRPGECTKIFRACNGDIGKITATLRTRLDSVEVPGSPGGTETPSGPQNHPAVPPVHAEGNLEASVSHPGPKAKSEDHLAGSAHPTSLSASVPNLSPELPADQEDRRPINGSRGSTEVPSGLQSPSTVPSVSAGGHLDYSVSPPGPNATSEEHLTGSGHPISHPASIINSSPELPADQENRRPIRDGLITAAKKTFKVVETVSGAIPGVGDFVGVAAKVGLAFVDMIETMDQNEDVSKELASHTLKLSTYLDYFKKKSDVGGGDDLVTHIDNLHRELGTVQKKVSLWNSSGRLKKAFLASEHAEELKGYQDTIQNALEEMQLLVSLKTADVVIEHKNSAERRHLLNCLGDGSYGARGSSIEDVICLPGTRVGILDRINKWIRDTSSSTERVLWIRGMAGRGKSAIASTVAHNWASKGSCAIFHFRRGQNALDGQFICALARQLGKGLVPEVKKAVLDCVRENEDIAKERLDEQFKTLLVGSLGKLQDHTHPIVIIVDALDECNSVTDAIQFVSLIKEYVTPRTEQSSPILTNVKFILTCRPEAPLPTKLKPKGWLVEDLDSISDVSADITRFVEHAFEQIRNNPDHGLPETWPSPAELKGIVEMSQDLFQWARTAMAFIGNVNRSPADQLQDLLRHSSTLGELDDLYDQIVSKAFKEVKTDPKRERLLLWILGTVVVAPYPVSLDVIAFLYADHETLAGRADMVQSLRKNILADLNSLIHISTPSSEPMRLMHTSIRDFLTGKQCERKPYSVDVTQDHRRLAIVCLQIMGRDLKQNICGLSDISKSNSEVQGEVNKHLSQGLRYCCRSWSAHLMTGVTSSEIADATSVVTATFQFISDEKLLSWLEVMSLIGATSEASMMVKGVQQWLRVSKTVKALGRRTWTLNWRLQDCPEEMSSKSLNILWNDTQRFIAAFYEPISFGALHIYASALTQCPEGTMLWTKYGNQATTRMLLGKRQQNWPAIMWISSATTWVTRVTFSPDGRFLASGLLDGTIQILDAQTGAWSGEPLTGHRGLISSVVFSPDGKTLASGSKDNTVRLWDAQSGALLGEPMTGHSALITSVVFSPDGKTLASGWFDKTVRFWDARSGAPLGGLLTGHSDMINSVVFSPDSKTLASGSRDKTIQLWDAQTGAPLGEPMTGHSDSIISVVFAPDGKTLASGSYDKTVRLWNAQTGAPLGEPLTGHSESINSVVFSPDGKTLASGSYDNTVRLWNAQSGGLLGEPMTGYSAMIASVVFSPDGKTLASGSWDRNIRLWDAQSGAPLGEPLTGHGGFINSVAFSPDGKTLASGSNDQTVRLWDAQSGASSGELLTGHSDMINSVVFSPDSKTLASGSRDKTIQLWDAQTGAPLGEPMTGHSDSIISVVFAPDGKTLASRSQDNTVRLWDVQSGAPLGEPLTGHSASITSVVFSPDGKTIASGSTDQTVRLWDAQTGAPLGEPLTGHRREINSVIFSSDGKTLASWSHDATVRLWDAQSRVQLVEPLTGHWGSISSVVFSPDGKTLASGSRDNTVRLWDVQTGGPLGEAMTGHIDWITSVVFSPDGKTLASGSDIKDPTVRLWDAQTGTPMGEPLTDDSEVLAPGGLYWGLPWANKAQIFDGSSSNLIPRHAKVELDWVICGSKRVMWVPANHRQSITPTVTILSPGVFAIKSLGGFDIFDVSRSFKF